MRSIALHLGVHKTASTHFQACLESVSGQFKNVSIYCPKQLRHTVTARESLHVNGVRAEQKRNEVFAFWKSQQKNVILSDENILGECSDAYGQTRPYADAYERLKHFEGLLRDFDSVRILVVIREFADFLPAFYLESLRWMPRWRPFDALFSGNFKFSWVDVVHQIAAAVPQAKIAVVPYGQYQKQLPAMLTFMGLSGAKPDISASRRVRPSPHLGALKAYEALSWLSDGRKLNGVFNKLSGYKVLQWGQFDPLSSEEKIVSLNNYQKDLQALREAGYLLETRIE